VIGLPRLGFEQLKKKGRKLLFTTKQTRAMKHAPRLYDVVLELIRQFPWSDLRHAVVFAWMVIGMIDRDSRT
jgi:hypothetical protein